MDAVAIIVKNAERLLNDARLLAANGSFRTAESLAVLSMEESGKACLVRWRLKGYLNTDIKAEIRGHLDKQRIFRSFRAIAAIRTMENFVTRDDMLAAFANDKNFAQRLIAEFQKQTQVNVMSVDSGFIEYVKQHGFYTDISDQLEVVCSVMPFTEEGFRQSEQLALEHITMATADDATQKQAAAVYLVFNSWPKFNKKQRDAILKAMLDAYVPPIAIENGKQCPRSDSVAS